MNTNLAANAQQGSGSENVSLASHPDLKKPVVTLKCCCCGGATLGRQFHNQDTGFGLGACCVDFVKPRTEDMARTYGAEGIHFNVDPAIQVREAGNNGEWSTWHISQNLTDRWGGFNYHNAAAKPLEPLEDSPELLERLRSQMWDEITFVTRKDGQFGILFEVEFCSRESEEGIYDMTDDWYKRLPAHSEAVARLLRGLEAIAPQYPGVCFAVPRESEIVEDRPAAWAFVPDGLLTDETRMRLGSLLLEL